LNLEPDVPSGCGEAQAGEGTVTVVFVLGRDVAPALRFDDVGEVRVDLVSFVVKGEGEVSSLEQRNVGSGVASGYADLSVLPGPGGRDLLAGGGRQEVGAEVLWVPHVAAGWGPAVDEGMIEDLVSPNPALPLGLGRVEVISLLPEGVYAEVRLARVQFASELLEGVGQHDVHALEGGHLSRRQQHGLVSALVHQQRSELGSHWRSVQSAQHLPHVHGNAGGLAGDQDYRLVGASSAQGLRELLRGSVRLVTTPTTTGEAAVDIEQNELCHGLLQEISGCLGSF